MKGCDDPMARRAANPMDKTAYIPGGVGATDTLLDDYNVNLEQWRDAGGHGAKLVNHINDHGLVGARWEGDRVRYDDFPPFAVAHAIEQSLGLPGAEAAVGEVVVADDPPQVYTDVGAFLRRVQQLTTGGMQGWRWTVTAPDETLAQQVRNWARELQLRENEKRRGETPPSMPEAVPTAPAEQTQPKPTSSTKPPTSSAPKKPPAAATSTAAGALYNKEELKALPMAEVCAMLGLELKREGSHMKCAVREERTPSCVLYENNTYYDFGEARGGDTIDLVMYATGKDFKEACEMLGSHFGVQPVRRAAREEGRTGLTDAQYRLIGIQPDMATKNFDLDLENYGEGHTARFVSQYRDMTVQQLAKEQPEIYHNMLRARAVPYVHAQRQEYFSQILMHIRLAQTQGQDVLTMPNIMKSLEEAKRKAQRVERTLTAAINDGSLLAFKPHHYDVAKDVVAIREGRIQPEIGSVPYATLKQELAIAGEAVAYLMLGVEEYDREAGDGRLRGVQYAAFYRGSATGEAQVNVVAGHDALRAAFPERSLKEGREDTRRRHT